MVTPSNNQASKRLSKRRARQHSKFVQATRLSLPIIMIGIVAIYLIAATPSKVDQNFLRQFANLDAESKDLRLERPIFVGEDINGIPYELNADAAVQNPNLPKLINLENPEALKALGTVDQALVSAKNGLYSLDRKTIDLNTEVEFIQGIGDQMLTLKMDAAEVVLENRVVKAQTKVYGETENGTIQADGMTAYQEEGRTTFHNARMIIGGKGKKNTNRLTPNTINSEDSEKSEEITPDS